jgi:quinol monooxygenase YgiN
MFARLTFINIKPERLEDVKKIYNEEVFPVIKQQKGNIGAWLLEPTINGDDFISLTEWVSEADARAYETNGTYKMMIEKIKDMYTIKPMVKTYNIAENKIVAPIN